MVLATKRLQLQQVLEDVAGEGWTVYFQPPPNIAMQYPCVVYSRDDDDTKFAGNRPYSRTKRYQVMVIDPDPDSLVPDMIAELPLCSFQRHYTADNLNHDVFNLYF